MKKKNFLFFGLFIFFLFLFFPHINSNINACTMILCGKNSTKDGSILLAHNNDLPENISSLIKIIPESKHKPEDKILFNNGLIIPQAKQTYRMLIMECYYGYSEGDAVAINQFQVSIAGGVSLKEDRNIKAREADPIIEAGVSGHIRYIALQRSKSARECVELIGKMYSKYGISYPSGVGVADPNEVWYIEAGGGKCWVAQRVPDNNYLVVANGYRIGNIDFNDRENFIFPSYLKNYTIRKGLWNPDKGPLNFSKIFGRNRRIKNKFYNTRRVWRVQNLLTPSMPQPPGLSKYPFVLKPDKKITVKRLIGVLRDYYNKTQFNTMNKTSLSYKLKERSIGVFSTVHTDVIQLRSWMPAKIGAVLWGGLGSPLSTPYIPYYFGIKEVLKSFRSAENDFDCKSAYWNFKCLAMLIKSDSLKLINQVLLKWQEFEDSLFSLQSLVEEIVLKLYQNDEESAKDFLTLYSYGLSFEALNIAKKLKKELKTKIDKKVYNFGINLF